MPDKFRRITIDEPEEWHRVRKLHLQASEAAIVMNRSPWGSMTELYDEKVGAVKPKDLSGLPYIRYGKAMEPLIRAQFELDHPYFKVTYREFDILESIERPWQGCTLDGELEIVDDNPWDLPLGEMGVLEIKTGSFRRRSDLEEWEGKVPDHYYCQDIHQLSVTGYGFHVTEARLRREPFKEEDLGFPEIVNRSHLILRKDVRDDIGFLEEEEAHFWKRVTDKRRPPLTVGFGKGRK